MRGNSTRTTLSESDFSVVNYSIRKKKEKKKQMLQLGRLPSFKNDGNAIWVKSLVSKDYKVFSVKFINSLGKQLPLLLAQRISAEYCSSKQLLKIKEEKSPQL